MRQFDSISPLAEVRDVADEVRRLFDDLERHHPARHGAAGVYAPGLDVIETDDALDIVVDVPGVAADAIRVLIKGGVVVVAGEKTPPDLDQRAEASFHLLERGFGRFARAIRLHGAFHGGRATASLEGGELRIHIPRIPERRGKDIMVPIHVQTSS